MHTNEYIQRSSELFENNPNFNLHEKALYMATWLKKERPTLYSALEHDFERIESEIYAQRECDAHNWGLHHE